MLVSKAVETDKGTIHFEGELSQEEVDLVLGIGLNYLLAKGVITSVTVLNDSPDTVQ